MSESQDPKLALRGFQEALTAGDIQPLQSTLYPELVAFHDDAGGSFRCTYALMDGKTVKAMAVYFLDKAHGSLPCFDLGYAVAEPYRKQGFAHAVVEKSLAQLHHDVCGMSAELYVEAIVPNSNLASQKVAARALGAVQEEIKDSISGESSARYLKLIQA